MLVQKDFEIVLMFNSEIIYKLNKELAADWDKFGFISVQDQVSGLKCLNLIKNKNNTKLN